MTQEEAAIKSCEDRIKHLENAPVHYYGKRRRERAIELERVKIDALTPPTQEQVNKAWRGEWEDMREAYNDVPKRRCSRCKRVFIGPDTPFCEACGAPMTDEAVEMEMERLEELKDE